MGLYDNPFGNPFDLRRFAQQASPPAQSPLLKAYRNVSFGDAGPLSSGPTTPEAIETEDPMRAALARFTGPGRATEAYRSHLSQLPQGADYAPSKWRRLGAALTAGAASFGRQPQNAMQLGEEVRDAKFKGALNDWQLRGAGLKEQANMEADDSKSQLAAYKQYIDHLDKEADNKRADILAKSTIDKNAAQIANYKTQGYTHRTDDKGNDWMVKVGEEPIPLGPGKAATDMANAKRGLDQTDTRDKNNLALGRERNAISWGGLANSQAQTAISGRNSDINAAGLDETKKRTGIAQQDANTRAATAGYVPVGSDDEAEAVAARRVSRTNADYAKYLDDKGFVKIPADYQVNTWYNPKTWGKEVPPTPTTDPTFDAFIKAVEAEKAKIISTRRPGMGQPSGMGGNPNSINFSLLPK